MLLLPFDWLPKLKRLLPLGHSKLKQILTISGNNDTYTAGKCGASMFKSSLSTGTSDKLISLSAATRSTTWTSDLEIPAISGSKQLEKRPFLNQNDQGEELNELFAYPDIACLTVW